jgi:hypothetical protein
MKTAREKIDDLITINNTETKSDISDNDLIYLEKMKYKKINDDIIALIYNNIISTNVIDPKILQTLPNLENINCNILDNK